MRGRRPVRETGTRANRPCQPSTHARRWGRGYTQGDRDPSATRTQLEPEDSAACRRVPASAPAHTRPPEGALSTQGHQGLSTHPAAICSSHPHRLLSWAAVCRAL